MAKPNKKTDEQREDYNEHGLGAHETAGHRVAHDEDQAAGNRPLPAAQRSMDDRDLKRAKTSNPETPTSIGQQG
jgi:hypothetical protein